MGLGEVEVVFAAQHTVETHGVADAEHGGIEVDDAAAQLVVDIGLAGRITQEDGGLGGAHKLAVAGLVEVGHIGLVHGLEGHITKSFVFFNLSAGDDLEAPVGLIFKGGLLAVIGHHLVGFGPFHGHEDIILVGLHEAVARRTDILR